MGYGAIAVSAVNTISKERNNLIIVYCSSCPLKQLPAPYMVSIILHITTMYMLNATIIFLCLANIALLYFNIASI